MHIINNLLSMDPGETYNFRKELNGKTVKSLSRKTLVIHATEGADVAGAVAWLQPPPLKGTLKGELSIHLVVGKDGKEIVQMVPFDKGAQHAGSDYNTTSIGIELDYPSLLTEKTGRFNSMDKYAENQYILAKNLNGKDYNFWPLYPRDQLDALVVISKALIETYGITDVVGHEEFYSGKQDPGPAFPIIQFREKLLGANERSMVLQETTREVMLRNGPAQNSVLISASRIPAGTPVAVVNEKDDCYLIAIIAEIDGNPWLTGWVDKSAVQIKRNAPLFVQEDHYLSTMEGRRFQVIEPDPLNYDSNPKFSITNHKYIIMHITTGTRMESTINTFRNPASGVSSHLLIGREGQVVQFLPFNKIAWHSGYSWWEGDRSLNSLSIGIELDNAGPLEKNETGQWVPIHKKIVIPEDKVQLAQHWKETRERGWEKFTDIQLQVTLDIVKALVAKYGSIVEILGHDVVNLHNRTDPGPLFPMEDFREQLFGRRQPIIKEYEVNIESVLYANRDGALPDIASSTWGSLLPKGAQVEITKTVDEWAKVRVLKLAPLLRDKNGWVKRLLIESTQVKKATINQMKINTEFFKPTANPPTERWPILAGTRVRIQEVHDKQWTLVAILGIFNGKQGLEGWIQSDCLTAVP